ncbi:MAG: hypothetical protein QXU18_06870, partial [Thermoplasmatales archaeon]
VYLFEAPEFTISASNINQTKLTQYQENVMIGGSGDLLYNLLEYNSNVIEYNVTFAQKGLPSGNEWSVTITNKSGSSQVYISSGSQVSFKESNGTYSYNVSHFGVYDYSVNPHNGTIKILGHSLLVNITFSISKYPVTFKESGLPAGTTWFVNDSQAYSFTSQWYFQTNLTSLIIPLPNGTYSFFAVVNSLNISRIVNFTVNGNSLNVTVNFTQPTASKFSVTFTESGLPLGTTWYVNLSNGQSFSSTTSTISFNESNGTYSYTIRTSDRIYFTSESSGFFNINGNNVKLQVEYNRDAYVQIALDPINATLLINGVVPKFFSSHTVYLTQGYYYINVTETGYTPYTNYVHLYFNHSYSYSISLKPIENYGYLAGTVSPINSTVSANGIIIPIVQGKFNVSLAAGVYYITATSYGYNSYSTEISVTDGNTSSLSINMVPTQVKPVIISGTVSPNGASVTVNGLDAYVNATGFFNISIPAGNYTISAYMTGYYAFSTQRNITSNYQINITLIREPTPTSTSSSSNVTSTGYNVTVSNITSGNGTISLDFNSTSTGVIQVNVPYSSMRNATIQDILNSKVYVNGTRYTDFTITITSNYSIILTVYNLSGDPNLVWAYIPGASVTPPPAPPTPTHPAPFLVPYFVYVIIAVAIIGISVGSISAVKRRKKLQ